ncbi:hypothetical protein M413DRAFT_30324 [Hebeloma cylindrosporum]|uniref:Uncharacterized protein n=1 Tax=Hebeloma cylindrosporum TaxID=76867 RepID=A0A0C3BNG7_HEBCY|nr:hypothetical protein M413DRAFT_30324 [Hebeloma cylindrosporum h7]
MVTSDFSSYSSGDYRTFQLADPIYDGRYVANRAADTRAPPVELYHPVFVRFLDDIANDDLEVPDLVIRATARLLRHSSAIYDSEDSHLRRSVIGADLMDATCTAMPQVVELDKYALDGTITTATPIGNQLAAICIREDTNEMGDEGPDPSIQAGLSYGRFWAHWDVGSFEWSLWNTWKGQLWTVFRTFRRRSVDEWKR